jgi:hypothetical protein
MTQHYKVVFTFNASPSTREFEAFVSDMRETVPFLELMYDINIPENGHNMTVQGFDGTFAFPIAPSGIRIGVPIDTYEDDAAILILFLAKVHFGARIDIETTSDCDFWNDLLQDLIPDWFPSYPCAVDIRNKRVLVGNGQNMLDGGYDST